VYARGYCLLNLLHSMQGNQYLHTAITMGARPGTKPRQHFYDLMFCFHHSINRIMYPSKSTPLSTLGPQTSSNLLIRVTSTNLSRQSLQFITFSYSGAMSLSQPGCPFAPESWKPAMIENTGARPVYAPFDFRAAAHGHQCPLCRTGIADPWHIIHECTHHVMAQQRGALHRAATRYLPVLSTHILHTQSPMAYNDPFSTTALAHTNFTNIHSAMDWTTPTGKSTLYRLLLVLPWPAAAVNDASALHTIALGNQFDVTVAANNHLHRLANSWTLWAASRLKTITLTWKRLVDQQPPIPSPPPIAPSPRHHYQLRRGGPPRI
jgi:hypothetical protein